MKVRNKRINQAKDELMEANQHFALVIKEVQTECFHTDIAECPYESETAFCYSQPPWRVCIDCGLAEEGWGSGYKVLIDNSGYGVRQISRTNLFQIACGDRITK